MSREKKSKIRHWALWVCTEPEKEEPFLTEMSRRGWHLQKTTYFRHIFRRGEPIGHQYRMDFMDSEHRGPEFEQIYQDAGWEKVCESRDEFGRWGYFRRPEVEGETLELYTDAESKLELLYRIRKAFRRKTILLWMILLPFLLLLAAMLTLLFGLLDWLIWNLAFNFAKPTFIDGFIGGLIGGIGGGAATFGFIGARLKKKIRQLEESKL